MNKNLNFDDKIEENIALEGRGREKNTWVRIIFTLFLGVFLINLISSVNIYDDFNDNSIDQTKWKNQTEITSGGTASINETGGKLDMGVDLSSPSDTARVNLTSLTTFTTPINWTMSGLETAPFGGTDKWVFCGVSIGLTSVVGFNKTTSVVGNYSTGNWGVYTSGGSTFVMNDSGTQRTINSLLTGNVTFNCLAESDAGGGAGVLNQTIDNFYMGTDSINISVQLNSPSNSQIISSFPYPFNATLISVNYNFTNYTFFVWYSNTSFLNQTTTSVTTNGTIYINPNLTSILIENYIWNVYGCQGNGAGGNCSSASANRTFIVGASLNTIAYNNQTYETGNESFIAVFNIVPSSEISQMQLVYNGTNYTITDFTQASDNITLRRTLDIPLNINNFSNETKSFFFRFIYSGSFIQESETKYQNISFINLQLCNNTYAIAALNFTLKNELANINIDAATNPVTYQTNFQYWLGSGDVVKNYSYQTLNSSIKSNFSFCVHPYPSNFTFKTDMDTIFSASSFSENEYHLRGATLTNQSSAFDLFLYLISSADTTKFYVTIKDGITFVSDAIVTIAKFFTGEGQFKTTSIKLTDDDGQFPAYLDLDDRYFFSVVKNGVLLGTIEQTATCASAPCTIDINLQEGINSIFAQYYNVYSENVASNISFNRTSKIVTYSFIDTTGLAQYFRLLVKRTSLNDTAGPTICNTFAYTSAGSLTCNVSAYSEGDFYAYGFISRSPEKLDKVFSFLVSDNIDDLGEMGIFLNLAIIITLAIGAAVMSKGNPSTVIAVMAVAILFLKIANLFPFSWIVVSSLEALMIYILIKTKT